jgi:hypothetical protein
LRFDAINNVRGWWSQAEQGDTDKLGAVFYHHYQDVHRCTLKITELLPSKKVAWRGLRPVCAKEDVATSVRQIWRSIFGHDPHGMNADSALYNLLLVKCDYEERLIVRRPYRVLVVEKTFVEIVGPMIAKDGRLRSNDRCSIHEERHLAEQIPDGHSSICFLPGARGDRLDLVGHGKTIISKATVQTECALDFDHQF